ncbi:MAG: NAD-dependent malic enzyme [Gammaproteobacteria bacterium]
MLNYELKFDANTQESWIEVDSSLTGKALLSTPLLNKGTAFSLDERINLGLLGKLPQHTETLEEQVVRCYAQYKKYKTSIQRHIYLNNLHDRNEVLFYKLVSGHVTEMLPVIYTPSVSTAVKQFSWEFRQPRGLYIAYPDRDHLETIFDNRTHPDIHVIVVTDGERVLGIGDQGVGSIYIPIAKIMLYTLFGGLDPYRCLPIYLDAGTNNENLLADPLYLGWRHERLKGDQYDGFIDDFVNLLRKRCPKVFLHWEDFGRDNARRILEKYKDNFCTFNDDMQGTAIVTISAFLRASQMCGLDFKNQEAVIFGAGTAGVGIADELVSAWVRMGMSPEQARDKIWLIDKHGLLVEGQDLLDFQTKYAKSSEKINHWPDQALDLLNVLKQVKPNLLIGCSAMGGAFTEEHIRTMAANHARPIIFPLSNPTASCEALPKDIMLWTEKRALIATGSPFPDIAQCNNALAFPGLGLGILSAKARLVTNNMLWATIQAIVKYTMGLRSQETALLPPMEEAYNLAQEVALAVAKQALADGVSDLDPSDQNTDALELKIQATRWVPAYKNIRRK